ncbi:hypothetical protein ECHLIB_0523 [Ehrlichia chaffeensis str. Liberty]|uniref:DUF3023 domain-containing protein n=1 Tax=Ehrlichia chaffeensis TaxID=945 RepID=UPI000444E9D3|nr:DUF3023 domain-containing protein [Ehrlichia chaffeensis]AHX05587.1 hypothetical protein ECHJAX_0522 [Ehrlichia chaffeensis str. Jax]AHX06577.1 hypothetical protein ECHLIB_0523 [Ehrlichia chaffeensis str. Liberty]AHX09284.1 hypothetical protein ECHWAK_0517 [Ehrlichia chaffeensis str. Wakulla]
MQSLDIKKFVNGHLCRKADALSFIYQKCYCIGHTPEDSDTLTIHLSKTHKSKKKVVPSKNSLFVLNVEYPVAMMKQLRHMNFLTLSKDEMGKNVIGAKLYIFVKQCNLKKFMKEVLNNNKPGSTVTPSEYGSVVYTVLCNNKLFEDFNEHNALSTISKMALTNTREFPAFKFIPKVGIARKLLHAIGCVSQNDEPLTSTTIGTQEEESVPTLDCLSTEPIYEPLQTHNK